MSKMKLSPVDVPSGGNGLPPPRNEILHADMTAQNLIDYQNHLLGQILTIIDASISDKDQLRAVKNLIKQTAWQTYDEIWRWMNDEIRNKQRTFPFGDRPIRNREVDPMNE